MKYSILLAASLLTSSLYAQNGELFKEKNTSVTEHFVSSDILQEGSVDERYGERTRSEGFVVEGVTKMGSVFTKKLHRSGKVIFNSEAGDYLNQLKSKLLEDYPKVDDLINVYITENPTLNAFATVNNNIYFNIGLLARVENEAQLAFIMSHEIMHIVNAHIINQSLDINEKASEYNTGNIAIDDDFLQLYRHELSRGHETEADIDGFTLYLKHEFDPQEGMKALELLRKANDFTIDIPVEPKTLFMSDSAQFAKLNMDYLMKDIKDDEKDDDDDDDDDDEEEKGEEYETHPLIEDRIEVLDGLFRDVDSSKFNGIKFLVSEKTFNAMREEANANINRIFAEDLDFVSLFLNASARYHFYGDSSETNLNYLGYSLQGLIIDKVKKYKIGKARSTNAADSLYSYFYTKSKFDDFAKWSFEAIDGLYEQHQSTKLNSYHQSIVQTIANKEPDSTAYIFGDKLAETDLTVVKNINGLNINKLEFNITPFADMTRRMVKEFNETNKYTDLRGGKVAIVNMNNVKIRKEAPFTFNFIVDEEKCEQLDSRSDIVWQHMEEDYEDQIVSFVPNANDYFGYDYEVYDVLNQWIGERLYFNNYYYTSIHDDAVKSLVAEDNIRYAFSGLNIEIKSFSMKNFIIAYFSPFFAPHYLPQNVLNVIAGSTRKYQLSLVYDIETGALTFWDKRTYLEPNTIAQFQNVYSDVFDSLLNSAK